MTSPSIRVFEPIPIRRVITMWWPLAVSWMLMSVEPLVLTAVVARLADPDIHLAAYGSVAFPLISIIQAPILTLLSLSTAMSKDWDSFLKGRRLMFIVGGSLTLILIVVTFSPLYYLIVRDLIDVPDQVIEPARLGMFVSIPWTFSVAYRRFHQGVMIRFNHSSVVTVGTLLRFAADGIFLVVVYQLKTIPGTMVAVLMMVCGVITEAIYVGLRVRPILQNEVKRAPSPAEGIRLRDMVAFFIPLAITPLLNQLIRPIGTAALSRLPDPLITLAVFPVISSLSFLIVTPGAAFTEVVIALLDRPNSKKGLRQFLYILMGVQLTVMLVMSTTSLAYQWFYRVSGLEADIAKLASQAFRFLIPSSLISPLNSWFTGAILHSHRSRSITEGMAIYLAVYILALTLGGRLMPISGIYIAIFASIFASLCQTSWLAYRSWKILAGLGE